MVREIKKISSLENQVLKRTALLKQKKYRDRTGTYLIEGLNLIMEAVKSGGILLELFFSEQFSLDEFEGLEAAAALKNPLREMNIPSYELPEKLFVKLCDTEEPQGIVAVVKRRVWTEAEVFGGLADGKDGASSGNILVLDRLQDPGNIGTMLRTADAAGYAGALILKGTADLCSPKVVRAAAGSLFRLPCFFADTPEAALDLLRRYEKRSICTTPHADKFYYQIPMAKNICLIIGNEANGVCGQFLEQADLSVKIPMEEATESLNASVAAAILMYESVRQKYMTL